MVASGEHPTMNKGGKTENYVFLRADLAIVGVFVIHLNCQETDFIQKIKFFGSTL